MKTGNPIIDNIKTSPTKEFLTIGIKKELKEYFENSLPFEVDDDIEKYSISKEFVISGVKIFCQGTASFYFEVDQERNDTPESTETRELAGIDIDVNYEINGDLIELEIDKI